jgi:hypothetical protein
MSITTNSVAYKNLTEREKLIATARVVRWQLPTGLIHVGDYNMYPEKHVEVCLGAACGLIENATASKQKLPLVDFKPMTETHSYDVWANSDKLFGGHYMPTKTNENKWKDIDLALGLEATPFFLGHAYQATADCATVTSVHHNREDYEGWDGFTLEGKASIALQPYMPEEMLAFPKYVKRVAKVTNKVSKDIYNIFKDESFNIIVVGTVNHIGLTDVQTFYLGTFSIYGQRI